MLLLKQFSYVRWQQHSVVSVVVISGRNRRPYDREKEKHDVRLGKAVAVVVVVVVVVDQG